MKYYLIAYNYLTLCKSLRYTDTCFGRENVCIIYTNGVSELPEKIGEDYPVVKVSMTYFKGYGLAVQLSDNLNALNTWHALKREMKKNREEECTLIVFKDNETREATCIEKAKSFCRKGFHCWMIEEGLGLYSTVVQSFRNKRIHQLLNRICGVSEYKFEGQPQGVFRLVDRVICKKPQLLSEKYKDLKTEVREEIPIFDWKLSEYFIRSVLGTETEAEKYRFVFLTMPMQDVALGGSGYAYEEFLEELFRVLAEKGNCIIKCHPRDKFDYSCFLNEQVKICDTRMNSIPFECLYEFYGKPQLISLYSSACANIDAAIESVFLYRLMDVKMTLKVDREFCKTNRIIDCGSFGELENIIS